MIDKVYLEKFKRLYKEKYHISLSDEETLELATHFLQLMEVLIKPSSNAHPSHVVTQESRTIRSMYETC